MSIALIVVAVLALVIGLALGSSLRRCRSGRDPQCPRCGSYLNKNIIAPCPKCGWERPGMDE